MSRVDWKKTAEELMDQRDRLAAENAELCEVIELYELALKASWPEGAMGEAFDYWNTGRAALAKVKER